jgi:polyhydroxyalkanoate synthesis regulator protein
MEIIRYKNRKLYCKETRSYVNLRDVVLMIHKGLDVTITCNEKQSDITQKILATYLKMVYEQEVLEMSKSDVLEEIKKKRGPAPRKYRVWQKKAQENAKQKAASH